jgi:hypothetical protein
MSWSPELYIGEFRPWPDTVHVVRGKTEEKRRYVSEEMLFHERDGHDEQFERDRSLQAENAKLRELVQELYERAWLEYPSAFERAFLGRIRELGIEVNP